jgi:hypothetical protein
MIPENVVQHFAASAGLSNADASAVFKDLECYLALASANTVNPTKIVDDAWHSFILHTRDYAEYCLMHFGKFIHHVPSVDSVQGAASSSNSCSSCSNACSSNCKRG